MGGGGGGGGGSVKWERDILWEIKISQLRETVTMHPTHFRIADYSS